MTMPTQPAAGPPSPSHPAPRAGGAARRRARARRPRARPPTSGCWTAAGPSDWVHTDPWRVLRIQSEFVEGFGLLAELPRAVSVFGSARTPRDHPHYAAGVRDRRRAGPGRLRGHHRRRPGRDGGGQPGRQRGRRAVGRPGHRAAVRAGPQRVGRRRHRVPLLLRAQDDVREVRPGVRDPARRLRHPRRAVRGAHPRADPQGHPVPGDPVRHRVLVGAARLDPHARWPRPARSTPPTST